MKLKPSVVTATRAYLAVSSIMTVASSIVFAACGPGTQPHGGQCVLNIKQTNCYQSDWTSGSCLNTSSGTCVGTYVSEPNNKCVLNGVASCSKDGTAGTPFSVLGGIDTGGTCKK